MQKIKRHKTYKSYYETLRKSDRILLNEIYENLRGSISILHGPSTIDEIIEYYKERKIGSTHGVY